MARISRLSLMVKTHGQSNVRATWRQAKHRGKVKHQTTIKFLGLSQYFAYTISTYINNDRLKSLHYKTKYSKGWSCQVRPVFRNFLLNFFFWGGGEFCIIHKVPLFQKLTNFNDLWSFSITFNVWNNFQLIMLQKNSGCTSVDVH